MRSAVPFPSLIGKPKNLVGQLISLKGFRGIFIARTDIGMHFLGFCPPRLLDLFELGIDFQAQKLERAQFVAASRAVPGACPAIMRGLPITGITRGFIGLALDSFFGIEAGKIVPPRVVFGGVLLTEVPAIRAVG